jgi:hypothetical protein
MSDMKTKKELTYTTAVIYGIATELLLVIGQYIFLAINHQLNPDIPLKFSTEYMMSRGFYVFQILGVFLYTFIVYMIASRYTIRSVTFVLAFLIAAAFVELTFYLSIPGTYQGAYLFSILDKVVAAIFGVILYYSVGKSEEVG